jgi:hypothetical protein
MDLLDKSNTQPTLRYWYRCRLVPHDLTMSRACTLSKNVVLLTKKIYKNFTCSSSICPRQLCIGMKSFGCKLCEDHLLNMLLQWVEIIIRKIWHTKVVIRRHKLKTENTMDKRKKTNNDLQNTMNWAMWSSCKPRLNSGAQESLSCSFTNNSK